MKNETFKVNGKEVPKKVLVKVIGKVIAIMTVMFILRAILPYYVFIGLLFTKGIVSAVINKMGG